MYVCQALLQRGYEVIGLDNLNAYYDTRLKFARLAELGVLRERLLYNSPVSGVSGFTFIELDLQDAGNLSALFARERFGRVIHLAAQAGVRYSITNPRDYIDSNIIGTFNLLEACRNFPVRHFVFASSSSVYGDNAGGPLKETASTDAPVSFYAASKKANEVMSHAYAHLYGIPCTGLRFFTVYGPWGRPDMAVSLFARAIDEGTPIRLFNNGDLRRDFTYIDDIVEGVCRVAELPFGTTSPPYRLYNIGRGQPAHLTSLIAALERELGRKAILDPQPMQPGDVYQTYADTAALQAAIGYAPSVSLKEGIAHFAAWWKRYSR